MTLTKQQIQKWIKALRSEEYVQGKRVLCRINKDGDHAFCCLGVLVNELEGFDILPRKNLYAKFNHISSNLPEDYLNKAIQDKLIAMNDGRNKSFEEIADWIEETLLK